MKRVVKPALAMCAAMVLIVASGIQQGRALEILTPNPRITSNTFELLRYQDSGYKYLVVSSRFSPPPPLTSLDIRSDRFADPEFDDFAFKEGRAAFGGGSKPCSLDNTVQTNWPINTELLVRRIVEIPEGATNLRIMVAGGSQVRGVFVNGTRIGANAGRAGCPIVDEVRFDVPQKLVWEGPNTLAFDVVGRGVASFFDTRVLADIAAAQLSNATAISVPVSNVQVTCNDVGGSVSSRHATVTFTVTGTKEAGAIDVAQSITNGTTASITSTSANYSLAGRL